MPPLSRLQSLPTKISRQLSAMDYLDQIQWTADGLVPAIAQEANSGQVLMMAWMNREALQLTVAEQRAVYWSRSRQKIWRKGEESGHRQVVREIRLDCDNDVILLQVEQVGGIACHTGRASCFYQVLKQGQWQTVDPILDQEKLDQGTTS
jgi:phosphoribosyl-AMP cyclohydrolase